MRFRFMLLGALLVGVAACDDDPLKGGPDAPPPPTAGVQAYLEVDRADAKPGESVRVSVKVQFGTEEAGKLGSYTGSLLFDPSALAYKDEIKINDGLRVANPNAADQGTIRFAGAAAKGFQNLTLYTALFEVKRANYDGGLKFEMQELSAALSLENMQPKLQVTPVIFFSTTGH